MSTEANQYEIEIYEKAEHWTFSITVKAKSLDEAKSAAKAQYGSGYVVRGGARVS